MTDQETALQSLRQAKSGAETAKAFLMTEIVRRNTSYQMFTALEKSARDLLQGFEVAIWSVEKESGE
jgi:hypothetical protein